MKYDLKEGALENEAIIACLDQHQVIITLCKNAQKRSLSDKTEKYIKEIKLPILFKKGKREPALNTYFDDLEQSLIDNAIVSLVSTFEKQIFSKVQAASAGATKTVKDHYCKTLAFQSFISAFIKSTDDINKLSGVKKILENKILSDDFDQFHKIIKYRDYVAHGKRFDHTISPQLQLSQIASKLDKILKLVG